MTAKISWLNFAPIFSCGAYANKPRTIQEMENNIRREIAAISEDVLQANFANVKRRVQLCLDSGGNISSISSSIDMLFMKQGM